jgi:copper homeostasis protein
MIPVVRSLGGAGIVLGLLKADGRVDVEQTRELVELASPLPVTFHRAFDQTPDLAQAMEDVIAAGCARVLTSGGELNAVAGAVRLAALVQQAGARIDIAVGGGLRVNNVREVARISRATHFHASLKRTPDELVRSEDLKRRVAEIVRMLSLPEDSAAVVR